MAPESRPPKEDTILVRLDSELATKVREKASRYGSPSAVVRALLRRWVQRDDLTADEVLAEVGRGQPRPPRPPAKRKTK